jgi:hypothetical protein
MCHTWRKQEKPSFSLKTSMIKTHTQGTWHSWENDFKIEVSEIDWPELTWDRVQQ